MTSYQDLLPLKGHCYCGKITYELRAAPLFVNCCHCRNCQHLSGSAFAVNLKMDPKDVIVTSAAQPTVKESQFSVDDKKDGSDSSVKPKATLCSNCDNLLWGTSGAAEHVYVRAGTLERGENIVPSAHFFTRSKHPWITIPEDVPAFETLPTESEARALGLI